MGNRRAHLLLLLEICRAANLQSKKPTDQPNNNNKTKRSSRELPVQHRKGKLKEARSLRNMRNSSPFFQEVGAALKGSTNKCEGKCRNFYSLQSHSVILLLLNFPIAHRRHNRAQLTLLCQVPFLARAVHGSNRMLNP